jgi:hypothetical protein
VDGALVNGELDPNVAVARVAFDRFDLARRRSEVNANRCQAVSHQLGVRQAAPILPPAGDALAVVENTGIGHGIVTVIVDGKSQ